MGLRDQIPEDLKTALRGKMSLDLSVLRMLQTAMKLTTKVSLMMKRLCRLFQVR